MLRGASCLPLRIFVAIAFALVSTVSAAHRAAAAAPTGDPALAAFALPDGSLPSLCRFTGPTATGDAPSTACSFALMATLAGDLPNLAQPSPVRLVWYRAGPSTAAPLPLAEGQRPQQPRAPPGA